MMTILRIRRINSGNDSKRILTEDIANENIEPKRSKILKKINEKKEITLKEEEILKIRSKFRIFFINRL